MSLLFIQPRTPYSLWCHLQLRWLSPPELTWQACSEACLLRDFRACEVDSINCPSGHQKNTVRTTMKKGLYLNGKRLYISTQEALGLISNTKKTSTHSETSLYITVAISYHDDQNYKAIKWAGKIARWIRVFFAKLDDLCLIPGTNMLEIESQLPQVVF